MEVGYRDAGGRSRRSVSLTLYVAETVTYRHGRERLHELLLLVPTRRGSLQNAEEMRGRRVGNA